MSAPRDVRFARMLLRLYPRAWRERYGDEFVALIEYTGLGPRVVLDVIGAAGLERLRGFFAWRRREADPEVAERLLQRGPTAETLADAGVFLVLVSGLMAMLSPWIPWPHRWDTWFWLCFQWPLRYSELVGPTSTRTDRVAVSSYYYLESAVLTAATWSIARSLIRLGLPVPTDAETAVVLFSMVLVLIAPICVAGRGITRRLFLFWRVAFFAFVGWMALLDPGWQFFWMAVTFAYCSARLPASMSVAAVERRRAALAALQQRMEREFPIKPGGYF